MARRRIHVGEDGEFDAVDRDLAVDQRTQDLVVAAGKGEGQFFRHGSGFVSWLLPADSADSLMPGRDGRQLGRRRDGRELHGGIGCGAAPMRRPPGMDASLPGWRQF